MLNKNYRSDIDGIRAIAIISVLLFHLDVTYFSGGFVGVDIFFVISGFLITNLIKKEIETTNSFSFKNFYIRRIRRLFPALVVVLMLTAIFSTLILSPTHLASFGGSLTSSILSISNMFFWIEADYFDVSAKVKPLLHTWSLTVEEQFYFIWPITLLVLLKLNKQWKIISFMVFFGLLSLYMNERFDDGSIRFINNYLPSLKEYFADGSSTIFFLLPFRIYEFMIGAILVWVVSYRLKKQIGDSKLVVIGNVPGAGYNLYDIFTRPRPIFFTTFNPNDYIYSKANKINIDFNSKLSQASKQSGKFIFLDPHDVLCKDGKCRNLDDEKHLIYSDAFHLSKYGSIEVIKGFLPELKKYINEK